MRRITGALRTFEKRFPFFSESQEGEDTSTLVGEIEKSGALQKNGECSPKLREWIIELKEERVG